jgi:hypothetical protein
VKLLFNQFFRTGLVQNEICHCEFYTGVRPTPLDETPLGSCPGESRDGIVNLTDPGRLFAAPLG